jgi:pimeloyl-ACP methyl ester carboxylesterase
VRQPPTVVLVHGAFADASSYLPLYAELAGDAFPVIAPPNPLRGVLIDAAYTRSVIEQIDGPVLLVGHSYGCAATTLAGMSDRVVGLVYAAGYALEQDESLAELQGRFPDSLLAANLRFASSPAEGGQSVTEVTCDPAAFPEVHRFGFERAKMPTVEIEGASHLVIYSHPREVADVIREAVRETVRDGTPAVS